MVLEVQEKDKELDIHTREYWLDWNIMSWWKQYKYLIFNIAPENLESWYLPKNIKQFMTQDLISKVFGITQNSKRMCICGHIEGVHHNHMSYSWGTGSLCTRCTECVWDPNKGCYTFKEKKDNNVKNESN